MLCVEHLGKSCKLRVSGDAYHQVLAIFCLKDGIWGDERVSVALSCIVIATVKPGPCHIVQSVNA